MIDHDRARRKLERPGVPEAAGGKRIAEHLRHLAVAANEHDGIALVRIGPDVSCAIEREAVDALEPRMLDPDRIEAQRVGGERRVAATAILHLAVGIERHPPDRAARRVGDEQVALFVELDTVRDQILATQRVRRRPRREIAHLPAHAFAGHVASQYGAVSHRLDPEDLVHNAAG